MRQKRAHTGTCWTTLFTHSENRYRIQTGTEKQAFKRNIYHGIRDTVAQIGVPLFYPGQYTIRSALAFGVQ